MARSRSSGTAFDDRGLASPRPQCDGLVMTSDGTLVDHPPSPDEIRATVGRMIVSEAFGRSPQLGAFLRFVVEAVLQGKSDRIKGYTIGVEVLRRDVSFDPQSDPIVRVEATRLRRTLERYYAGPGADDQVVIDLPRGSYVPTFQRRQPDLGAGWLAQLRMRAGETPQRLLVLAALGAVLVGAIGFTLLPGGRAPPVAVSAAGLPPGNGMPTLSVETLEVAGAAPAGASSLLTEQIRDAFSRFDTINVVIDPKDGRRVDYRLLGSIDYQPDRTASVRVRLLDAEGNIVWSQAFDRVATEGEKAADGKIVTSLANALLQSYGVIRARDCAKHLGSSEGDPRYRCILQAADALRSAEPAAHESARACLERLTSLDPSFAVGYSFLAITYYREFLYGYGARPGDAPARDRALRAARRAIELNPASARGYQMLMVILFARGDIAAAFAAGDKAMALNPYAMLTVAEYGGRLVMVGEIERGMAMLGGAGEYGGIRPSWHHFYLFLGSYLAGDMKEASYQASQITSEDYAFGLLAKALAAAAAGDAERARQAVDRLVALQPGWRDDPRRELGKIIPRPEIVERLARDLAGAALAARS
jgi:tetratricopeptide (TPR) repeat protein